MSRVTRTLLLSVAVLNTTVLSAQVATLVEDINAADPFADGPGSYPNRFVSLPGKVVFSASDQAGAGREPWVSDGTATGTELLADICPGYCSSEP
ncbi:MAG TPA: hypothetical protein VGC93_03250, partial [Thermoanaerobaculia bacterium]